MGLKEAFQKAAIAAFNAAGNVKKSAVYTSNPNPTYTPSTGYVTEIPTNYSVTAIREDFKFNDIDGDKVKPEDTKWLILYSELEIALKENDYVTIDSIRWNVVSWQLDPADAVWTIHVRQ
jgi:hypothetical protein